MIKTVFSLKSIIINKSIIKQSKSSNFIKYYNQTFLNKWEFLKEKYRIGRLSEYIIKRSILHNFLSTLHTCLDSQALIQMIRTFKSILGFLHYLFLHYLTKFLFSTSFIRKKDIHYLRWIRLNPKVPNDLRFSRRDSSLCRYHRIMRRKCIRLVQK